MEIRWAENVCSWIGDCAECSYKYRILNKNKSTATKMNQRERERKREKKCETQRNKQNTWMAVMWDIKNQLNDLIPTEKLPNIHENRT